MKNIAQKQSTRKQLSNVVQISNHPRFTPNKLKLIVPPANDKHGDYCTHDLGYNAFGLAEGDTLICRKDFNFADLRHSTLVVTSSGLSIAGLVKNEDIQSVVISFQRSVNNNWGK